ncbi:MAG: hypothetical protein HKN85_11645 [Gammaproteobacteria bacterium]|nr:hypothetical protein [Gammaproteobacteria bacterium]
MLRESMWDLDLSDVPEDQMTAFINQKRGMVRASISLYNDSGDVELLVSALTDINTNIDAYRSHYTAQEDGSYTHNSFVVDWRSALGWLPEQ